MQLYLAALHPFLFGRQFIRNRNKNIFASPMEHLLFEYSGGYALFELKEYEDMSKSSYDDYMELRQVLKFVSGMKFDDVKIALDHLRCLSKGKLHEELINFLDFNNVKVLHCDSSLKKSLEAVDIVQRSSDNIMRGVRKESKRLMQAEDGDDDQMTLGLAYAYSRDKVEYNIKSEDCIVIHTVSLLEQIDKDINLYSMRIREIYGWSFPELASIIKDNGEYVKVVRCLIGGGLLANGTGDTGYRIPEERIKEIDEAKSSTMGIKLSDLDIANLIRLIDIVDEKISVKMELTRYLKEKMDSIAPNLSAILGDGLAAKLISQAGGLFHLGKAPASTIQLLGAEKSLFRSLKNRSNTPKHGLLYNCLSGVRDRDKGKLSRYIATKCSIATKIDCFSEDRTPVYGVELKSLIDKKVRSMHTNESVERTGTVVQRVFDRIHGIEDGHTNENNNRAEEGGESEYGDGSRRVSFDLTRNEIRETEKATWKPKRRF